MNLFLSFKIALRYLGVGNRSSISNARKSLYGAVAGIGLSIVPLVTVLVISDGMIKGISSRLIELGTGHIQIMDLRSIPQSRLSAETARKTASILFDGLKQHTIPHCTGMKIIQEGSGLLIGKKGRSGGTVRAVEQGYFSDNPAATALLTVVSGSISLDEPNSVVLGKKIAEQTGLSVGDSCSLLTLMPTYRNNATTPRMTRLKVTGIISSGYQELDALWIIIPLATGNRVLSPQSSITSLVVRTEDPFDAAQLARVERGLRLFLPEGFSLYTWKELNRSQFYAFQTTKNMLVFIMILIVLVASVNIASAMIMLIMERRKEIAILKAAGTHPFFITAIFLFAGLLTSSAGLFIGLTVGILLALHINELFACIEVCLNTIQPLVYFLFNSAEKPLTIRILDPAYYLEYIPITLRFSELYTIGAGTLILSIIVCIFPAVYAGKEKPIESMRKIQ